VQVPPRGTIVCTRDVLGLLVQARSGQDLRVLLLAAKDFCSELLDVHAFCSFPDGASFDLLAESWLELRDADAPPEMVFGYADASLEAIPLRPDHPDNVPFRLAVRLMPLVQSVPGLGAAFADFRAARRQTGSYAAFFAFRVLEDVAYTFGDPENRARAWDAMNAAFGTTKEYWQPLTDAATAARHRAGRRISEDEKTAALTLAWEALQLRLRSAGMVIDWGDALREANTTVLSAVPGPAAAISEREVYLA